MTLSPLAPPRFPDLPIIDGVRFASGAAGVKYEGRDDVMLAELAAGTTIAGVFTRSSTRSAPVLDCQSKLGKPSGERAAFLVNSGNSNAFTGSAGEKSVEALCLGLSDVMTIPEDRIFTASTGVIGERLPHGRIIDTMNDLNARLSPSEIKGAASAIMTTDTFAKGASADVEIDGKVVRIAGIAKGSGMIAPDMATMLVYIFTDAKISQPDLQALLGVLNDKTFNCITVDSDTSTSDTLMVAATGASGVDVTDSAGFTQALRDVMLDLAHQVVRDGEGATKFVEIRVSGAASDTEARVVGLSIANSPLVKTAIAGEDPNWGRIVMAVGKSGAQADRDRLAIRFGDITVAENGWVSADYTEDAGVEYMKQQNLVIGVDLGIGGGLGTVWTCDLTHGYITINADYRS
ncbi:bifunctional glutamate N-acetyltransferase/amino-acid acetyltransferase ArgJ [Octadecabacter sp. G9-8]|uniref:Arginine biosynthesis bifunctional protein ArgJ n=1 Tax=Octadecabacter dasysiphoniae TaxID=2909341 RepID=A0ABS9CWW5_9RHOB|nr:bifunctional glutamate N-acetyltransferase/amino-acid acetyltransferase ArgJ [Octadecabacter dasysiphoniae]MCF2871436.1 bifunctional glutamate N-acetyltransferase/amino-acid acetyltransferase ArgJ [Octadecabacter dasysiphoniae]